MIRDLEPIEFKQYDHLNALMERKLRARIGNKLNPKALNLQNSQYFTGKPSMAKFICVMPKKRDLQPLILPALEIILKENCVADFLLANRLGLSSEEAHDIIVLLWQHGLYSYRSVLCKSERENMLELYRKLAGKDYPTP